ncbi:hypothetical protein RCH09_001843 [Actimicrobium sp. GrIS 1.19]|uniref:hypothetical protein n=1 Tax=Actimicrobium sp. GrIS 1.19 TaxID=3071708 RepID=UPI002DF77A24|nr:hypothetical protein [Actimicrobium sp. GrIS 1.19]
MNTLTTLIFATFGLLAANAALAADPAPIAPVATERVIVLQPVIVVGKRLSPVEKTLLARNERMEHKPVAAGKTGGKG